MPEEPPKDAENSTTKPPPKADTATKQPPTDTPKFTIKGLTGIDGGKARPKDTPPKNGRRGYARKPATPSMPPIKPGVIAQGLTNMYGQMGLMIGMFDPHCGTAIAQNAQVMGESLEMLAKESPQVRRFLESLVTTSVWGQVIAAHMPVVVAIASHHIPAIREKMVPPVPQHAESVAG